MKALACVVNWNGGDQLATALESLEAQTGVDLDIVVIDNASHDGSARHARRPGVRLVENPVNRGYAGAANQAVELCRDREALLVCNPDVRLEAGYVKAAVEALAADPARASVQGKLWRLTAGAGGAARVIDTTGHQAFTTRLFRNRGEGQPDEGQFDDAGPVFGVSGAVACYRVAALHDVACRGEVFDEALFAFWEDVDLDWRLALRGWSAWYAPEAVGWHERGGAGPRRSAHVERLNFTNRFLVIAKNDQPAALLRGLPGVVTTSVLKAGELALTVPTAFVKALTDVRKLPTALRKRRIVQARATVDPAAVVHRWFEPFDYGEWIGAWRRRVLAERSSRGKAAGGR